MLKFNTTKPKCCFRHVLGHHATDYNFAHYFLIKQSKNILTNHKTYLDIAILSLITYISSLFRIL